MQKNGGISQKTGYIKSRCKMIYISIFFINYYCNMKSGTKTAGNTKHQRIREALTGMLNSDKFKIGDKLPSERVLAERLQVNVLTIRRAFRELVAAKVVVKKIGSGTFLARKLNKASSAFEVCVIMDRGEDKSIRLQMESAVWEFADKYSVPCRVVNVDIRNLYDAIRSSIIYRQPTILCVPVLRFPGSMIREITACPGLFVIVGVKLDHYGIPSVIADDVSGIKMLIAHLREQGHRKIAFFSSSSLSGVSTIQVNAYKESMGRDFSSKLLINDETFSGDPSKEAYALITKLLPKVKFTALICATDVLMFGAAAALREYGLSIPSDVSLMSIGNTVLSNFCNPPVSGYDPDFTAHFAEAYKMLEANHDYPDEPVRSLGVVKPKLVLRQSTAPVKGEAPDK